MTSAAIPLDSTLTLNRPEDRLYIALTLIVFAAGVLLSHSLLGNDRIIFNLEMLFVLLYTLEFRKFPALLQLLKKHPATCGLLLLWTISMLVSVYRSPFIDDGLAYEMIGLSRYTDILAHVLFSLYVWSFLTHYNRSLKLLLFTIPFSALCVGLFIFVTAWQIDNPEYLEPLWWSNPPFNSHARHTGYQVTAALSICICWFIGSENRSHKVWQLLMLTGLWTFIFWLGGRGGMLAVMTVCLILVCLLYSRHQTTEAIGFIKIMLACSLLGLVLAEVLAVFSWNGLISALARTTEAENLNGAASGRLNIWKKALQSVQQYPVFGMGPRGYLLMPHVTVTGQPHNAFVQFLVEWGVTGTALFLGLWLQLFRQGCRKHIAATKRLSQTPLLAGAVIVSLSVLGLVDGTYYYAQPSFYLALAFGIWLAPERQPD